MCTWLVLLLDWFSVTQESKTQLLSYFDLVKNMIVVGGGIAGLALSIGLARLGYSVDLVERRSDLRKRGGATLSLQPNALKALGELCPEALEHLKDKGVPIPTTGGIMFMWWTVRDALLAQAEKHKDKITLWPGWTFLEVIDDPANPFVLAKFTRTGSDGSNGDNEIMELKGRMLIGTDGVHSSVRKALNLPPPDFAGSVFWRGTVIVPEGCEVLTPLLSKGINPVFTYCGPTALAVFNYHDRYPGVICWVIATKDPEALSKSHPMEVIRPYLDSNDEKLKVFQSIFELADPEETKYATRFETVEPPEHDGNGWGGKGRVTLLGDSAHAMRPAGGLGAALAFEDCVVFTRLLKELGMDALQDPATTERVVQLFENTRLPRVRKIWHNEKKNAEKGYMQSALSLDEAEKEFYEWIYSGV